VAKRIKNIQDLTTDKRNANRGTDRGRAMLGHSLEQFGAGRSILTDKDGNIIAGNKTFEQASEMGLEIVVVPTAGDKLVVVQRTDLDIDSPEGRGLAIADNRVSEIDLSWDAAEIKGLLDDDVISLSEFWNQDELDAMLAELQTGEEPGDDPGADTEQADALQEKWQVRRGDVWIIPSKTGKGEHRLLCGDSCDLADVRKLMVDEQAVMMWTDPPYGVNYVGKTADALTIENDSPEDLAALLEAAFENADAVLRPGAAIYISHPAGKLSVVFGEQFIAQGWQLHQTLVWVKDSMVLGHSDYHYRHEPILFGYKTGAGRRGRGGSGWYGDNAQTSVFEVPRPKASEMHPTMKPVELIVQHISNSSPKGGLVFDPFCGSGSTLVACEQLRRFGRAIELSEKYCAVILERLAGMGLEPVRQE
jgi:DNA modification methylase